MSLPSASLTVADGGLGATRTFERPPAVVGCSSGGTAATPQAIYSSEDAVTAFGYGKLTELIARYLRVAGGPVIGCKAATATAGAFYGLSSGATGTAAVAGAGGSPMTCTPSGTPRDDYQVRVKVTQAGATLEAATAAVKVSLDGGETYGEEQAVPTSGALVLGNTGVTITFSDSSDTLTLDVGAVYSFGTTGPIFDATSLGAALDALEVTDLDHEFVHVAEPLTAALAGTVKTSIESLDASGVYRWALGTTRDQTLSSGESVATWKGSILSDYAAFNSVRMAVCAGAAYVANLVEAAPKARRPVAWVIGPRLAYLGTVTGEGRAGIAESPERVKSGPIEGVAQGDLIHDHRSNSDLNTGRFMGLMSHRGRSGYYATAVTRAASGSDYTAVQRVRLICEAATQGLAALQEYIGENFRTLSGGTIDDKDAAAADAYLTDQLTAATVKRGYASSASVQVNRTDVIASTETLRAKLRVRPLSYAHTIEAEIGLTLE